MSQTPRRQQGRSGRKSEGCGLGDPRQGALPRLVLSSVWSTVEQSNTTGLRPERAPGAGSACRTGEVWWEILEDVAQARENRLCSCPRGTGCVSAGPSCRCSIQAPDLVHPRHVCLHPEASHTLGSRQEHLLGTVLHVLLSVTTGQSSMRTPVM